MPHLVTAVRVVSSRPSGKRKTEAPGVRPASPGRSAFAPGARRLYESPEASGCPPDASGFVETRLAYFELTETIVASANEYSSA